MPELPEVEGARKLVAKHAVGKRIVQAVVEEDEKVICDIAPRDLEAALQGRTLVAAKRRGKQMWWEFDEGPALLVHFGMTGGLVIQGKGSAHYKNFHIDAAAWPPRFVKLQLTFEDGTQLAFCDSRRFAKVRFLADPERVPPLCALGPDPLLDWPSPEAFEGMVRRQRRAIKAVLLDQSFCAGVGNWVADEVLYQACIHPEQPAHSLSAQQVAALHRGIRDVCQFAADVDADAERFPMDWMFHYRWGKGSGAKSTIGGHIIEHITVGGRTSALVPALQKLDKKAAAEAAAAATGGKAGGKKAAGGGKKAAAAAAAAAAATAEGVAVAAVAEEALVVQGVEGVASPKARRRRAKATAVGEGGTGDGGSAAAAPRSTAPHGRRGKAAATAAAAEQAGEPAQTGKSFRGRRAAAATAADEAPAAAARGAGGGRKRKAPAPPGAAPAAAGAAAGVSTRGRGGQR